MSKSLIYTAFTTATEIPIGSTVPVGSIIRRKGDCIGATGSAINLLEPGYYAVDISATFTAAAAGNVELSLIQDGVAIPGAEASATITTAATQIENVGITAVARVMCCGNSSLSVLVGGTAAPTISNMAFRVVRV